MENIKGINIKNKTYHFFDYMINMDNFNPDLRKINEKSYKILVFMILDISQ